MKIYKPNQNRHKISLISTCCLLTEIESPARNCFSPFASHTVSISAKHFSIPFNAPSPFFSSIFRVCIGFNHLSIK